MRGLGVDIIEIERMRAALERRPRLRDRCFSEAERAYCESRSRPEVHYALRFAAKEAILKALGTGFSGMRFTDIEVLRGPSGRPVPSLVGRAAEAAREVGVAEIHLSLSYTHTTAVASAVAIADKGKIDSTTVEPSREESLAKSFRDAKALIEDVGSPGGAAGRESDSDLDSEGEA